MRRYVVVDLDGTLTVDVKGVPYPEKPLNRAVAEATAAARARGFGVMVLTARGMRTWKNDRALVEEHVRPGVEAWLARHEVEPDEVQVAKPWCGPRGFYVDDRNLHPEEYVFRFAGPWSGHTFAAFVTGAIPAGDGLRGAHERLMRVERWVEVASWSYEVDAAALGDGLIGPPADTGWALVVRLGGAPGQARGSADPAAWLAGEHEALSGDPVVVRRGDAGFAFVPRAVVDQVGPDLDRLAEWIERR